MSGHSSMRRFLSPLWRFALTAVVGVILITLVWSQVSRWAAYPVGLMAKAMLEESAPRWIRSVQAPPGELVQVDSAISVANAQTGGRRIEISMLAEPGRYAYGLPIFLALMLASRGSAGRGWRTLVGYALLLPVQAFSLVMFLLMELVRAAQRDARLLKITMGQLEAIVYGFQVGTLVLPTLVPVLIWLWLERRFVNEVLVSAWRESLAPAAPTVQPEPPLAEPATEGLPVSDKASV